METGGCGGVRVTRDSRQKLHTDPEDQHALHRDLPFLLHPIIDDRAASPTEVEDESDTGEIDRAKLNRGILQEVYDSASGTDDWDRDINPILRAIRDLIEHRMGM